MSTNYKQPRKLNFVSISLYLLLAVGLYSAWKYVPPYYKAKKVDGILGDVRRDAGRFVVGTGDPREGSLLATLRKEVLDVGVDEETLLIYFADDGQSLNVQFIEYVTHPIGETVELEFHRKETIVPVGR